MQQIGRGSLPPSWTARYHLYAPIFIYHYLMLYYNGHKLHEATSQYSPSVFHIKSMAKAQSHWTEFFVISNSGD